MIERFDLDRLRLELAGTPLESWAATLPAQLAAKVDDGHGDLERWLAAVDRLPALQPAAIELLERFNLEGACDEATRDQLKLALQGLIPWRKGPFHLFGVHIDTEWRSDWKWERVSPHLDLTGKRVLDVGCGNGYYQWRMLGAGARSVVGVDPNWLFFCQFLAMKRYLPDLPAWHLPFALEDLPEKLEGFDTVFSMGVLYHRRSPIDHLLALKDCLRKGGELVLETLVVEGDVNTVLVPEDRYAQMRNVWFLPSVPALELWLRRAGFTDVRSVDISRTSVEEQRATEWMRYQSLPDFLDPEDHGRTIEGLPAPLRATLVARKP
ncbi:tRNA methyltransferase [Pseudomonas sp. 21]|uniref:tRNA 5-methoxyuridine(34)/uridine 5-oxyacetic acid(34) synthase CmoB n=1 Tax=unclassified Pseudomonas TaxID=196821 RepID=UPI0005EB8DFC|nr:MULTISPECIES: tRNA 5-methoxyuridine(34)/uridine 5-oxyacetic acid(34) synthase CmoB [unclassified Pseudomonas]KJK01854.1 tRNA methyltransferase [Pseudomonas sp. 21]MBV7582525.1 tRNA 5-methoxyuridine(34)/uridine 5-oxyacetic acid(34) synthase CmoB [Pseudomonas sp. PDM33]